MNGVLINCFIIKILDYLFKNDDVNIEDNNKIDIDGGVGSIKIDFLDI